MNAQTKIFVGCVPEGSKEEEICSLFEKYGTVTECNITNRCAFVHMSTEDEANAAICGLKNVTFNGAVITVEKGRVKERRLRNGGGESMNRGMRNGTGDMPRWPGGGGPMRAPMWGSTQWAPYSGSPIWGGNMYGPFTGGNGFNSYYQQNFNGYNNGTEYGMNGGLPSDDSGVPTRRNCPCCGTPGHGVRRCRRFMKMNSSQRRTLVRRQQLCYMCLGRHSRRECSVQARCDDCGHPHHGLICSLKDKKGPTLDVTSGETLGCACCGDKEHGILVCQEFVKLDAAQRRILTKRQQLCYICLGDHKVKNCEVQAQCSNCSGPHHALICTKVEDGTTCNNPASVQPPEGASW